MPSILEFIPSSQLNTTSPIHNSALLQNQKRLILLLKLNSVRSRNFQTLASRLSHKLKFLKVKLILQSIGFKGSRLALEIESHLPLEISKQQILSLVSSSLVEKQIMLTLIYQTQGFIPSSQSSTTSLIHNSALLPNPKKLTQRRQSTGADSREKTHRTSFIEVKLAFNNRTSKSATWTNLTYSQDIHSCK